MEFFDFFRWSCFYQRTAVESSLRASCAAGTHVYTVFLTLPRQDGFDLFDVPDLDCLKINLGIHGYRQDTKVLPKRAVDLSRRNMIQPSLSLYVLNIGLVQRNSYWLRVDHEIA